MHESHSLILILVMVEIDLFYHCTVSFWGRQASSAPVINSPHGLKLSKPGNIG
jgi:hypothetical protein